MAAAALAVVLWPAMPSAAQERGDDATALLEAADAALYPDSYSSRISMTTEKPGSRTELVADQVYKAGTGSRIEIVAPARSKGVRYLQKDGGLWMWSPRSGSSRALRLPAKESFQGSAFSNDDVSETRYAERYHARIVSKENLTVDGSDIPCIVVEATAKSPASPYGKLVMYLAEDGHYPLRIDFYSRSLVLYKRMTLYDLGDLAGRRRPRTMRMEALDGTDAVTTVRLESLKAEPSLGDRLFSLSDLTR